MRLFELIDFTPKISNIDKAAYSNRVFKGAPPTKTDAGHFARVTQHDSPKRLNQVNKVGTAGKIGYNMPIPRTEVDQDGYLSYLKMVSDDTTQNSYFPRIDDLKIRKDPETGNLTYNVKMEKLQPYDRIFDNLKLYDAIKERLFGKYGEIPDQDEITLWSLISTATDGGKHHIIKDGELLDAVEKIDKVSKKHGHNWDLGTKNMMWRVTGNMPQLVFTDPLA